MKGKHTILLGVALTLMMVVGLFALMPATPAAASAQVPPVGEVLTEFGLTPALMLPGPATTSALALHVGEVLTEFALAPALAPSAALSRGVFSSPVDLSPLSTVDNVAFAGYYDETRVNLFGVSTITPALTTAISPATFSGTAPWRGLGKTI